MVNISIEMAVDITSVVQIINTDNPKNQDSNMIMMNQVITEDIEETWAMNTVETNI